MSGKNLLASIEFPSDLRKLEIEQLPQVSQELRSELINIVSKTGGHLGAGLGVVELTVALHYVFNTPQDLLVWDVGHQTYPHKILTGRKAQMHTLRQDGGVSGFTKRSESIYDPFGAGHSSTSISAALGMAIARDIKGKSNEVIAVIGDGALSAGMAYEAMNNAGALKNRLIVILNDNEMSISPAVGAMSSYLCQIASAKPYLKIRAAAKKVINSLPIKVSNFLKQSKKYAKGLATGNNFFEEMGFHYFGPIDGHDVSNLVHILSNIKNNPISGPILLHVKTQKGLGFKSPEPSSENYHAVQKFDLESKVQHKAKTKAKSYSQVFGECITKLADKDKNVIAITAAMTSGTGLSKLAATYPEKVIDVGIAEQHAVTLAAGLAADGLKPFVAIYSTFLQRAYDQIIHDVAIQSLPVRFIIDRAGLVGADGATHAGSFDIMYLSNLPNLIVMAPSDEAELALMLQTSYGVSDKPTAVRFPRGVGEGVEIPRDLTPLKIGKSNIVQRGEKLAIVSLGTRLKESKKAAEEIKAEYGFQPTVVDARFAKPLDTKMLKEVATSHQILITIEEGSSGGFGSLVLEYITKANLNDELKLCSLHFPDKFLDHGNIDKLHEEIGLNASGIIEAFKKLY